MNYQEEVCNDDELLIKSVRSYANIFDKRNNMFKDKTARSKAWGAIAFALHKKPDECEQRWVVLRHRYVTEKRKMREDVSIKKSMWPLFNSMGFLDMFITPRKSSWNSKRFLHEESASTTPNAISTEGESSRDVQSQVEEIDIKNEEVEYGIVDSPSTSTTAEPPNDTFDCSQGDANFFKTTKKCEEQLFSSVATALGELREYLQSAQTIRQQESRDSDFSFGQTVALHLKDIENAKRKRHVKLQIMKILLGEGGGGDDDESKKFDK